MDSSFQELSNVNCEILLAYANIFLGLIEYEMNSLLGALHLIDYISVHIRFGLERYLLNIETHSSWIPKAYGDVNLNWKVCSRIPMENKMRVDGNTCTAVIIQMTWYTAS